MTSSRSRGQLVTPAPLLAAFAGAVAVRVALAGPQGATSVRAGLVFAVVLVAFAFVAGVRFRGGIRAAAVGVAAGTVVVVPAVLHLAATGSPRAALPVASFPAWAALTAVVAGAEEAFLRGVLYDAVARARGTDAAIVVAAVAFALLHVPFYGWHGVPIDLSVGLVLGVARLAAGSWTAPAIAHVGADLAGWWLV